jgi:hypothetical protein
MAEPLSAADRSSLAAEQGPVTMSVGGVLVFDAGKRTALLAKMHHALVDGVAAVDIGTVLLDPSEEPLDLPTPDGPWEARPYDHARHLARLSLEPMVRGQRLLAEGAQRALAAADPPRPRPAAARHALGDRRGGGRAGALSPAGLPRPGAGNGPTAPTGPGWRGKPGR